MVGLTWMASLGVCDGPTSATITASTWVREDPINLLWPQAPPTVLFVSSFPPVREGFSQKVPQWEGKGLWCFLCPWHLKWSNSQEEIVAGF